MPPSKPRRTAGVVSETVEKKGIKDLNITTASESDPVSSNRCTLDPSTLEPPTILPIPPPSGLSEPSGAELILENILEESARELFAFVEEIALGPKVTPHSNPYKQSQAVLKHINSIQQKAENFIDRFFDKLPSAAVIALREKDWVKHRGSRSRVPGAPPVGQTINWEEDEAAQVKNEILGRGAIGQATVDGG